MKDPNSAIKHLDGTMYASKVSSHCTQTYNIINQKRKEPHCQKFLAILLQQVKAKFISEKLKKTTTEGSGYLHWVAAEPPSEGLRCATWSTEILSASTVFKMTIERKLFSWTQFYIIYLQQLYAMKYNQIVPR